MVRPDASKGVNVMSYVKVQTAAMSLVAAFVVASLFVGAALEPVVSLA